MRGFDWVVIGLLSIVFFPALVAMSQVWSSLEYYSHGYLVAPVALWAATAQRHRLRAISAERDRRGLAVIGLAIAFDLLGMLGSVLWLRGFGVVAAVAGGVLYLRGSDWLKALRFSIAFLLFMVPLPEDWTAPLIAGLQRVVSGASVELLHGLGIAVFREGNVLVLPGGDQLFVAEACSGITSIITLMPLAVILGYFTEPTLGRRLVLVAAVIPVAMIGNLLRVVGTVVASTYWGVESATEGSLHDSAGLAVYVLGCLGLISIGLLMRWILPIERRSA